MRYSFREGKATTPNQGEVDAIYVDASCGKAGGPSFEGVAVIVEPASANPGIQVPRHIGVRGVLEVIRMLRQWRKDHLVSPEFQGGG